ncbi:MAG: tRNA (guanosine(37)-N1)-methyltransferase TrmD, partial [Clostridiales bacterium]|nr:tRNA (guanosine(37)-N1)-methyltransferase TrmD [Clostridiales bacterium]
MKIDVLTIFPDMFIPLEKSMIGRARESGFLQVNIHDIRSFSKSKHKNTDDYPYGGGAGMLMMVQPIADAIRSITPEPYHGKRILLSPRGVTLTQNIAAQLSKENSLLLLCGHYEGVDQR